MSHIMSEISHTWELIEPTRLAVPEPVYMPAWDIKYDRNRDPRFNPAFRKNDTQESDGRYRGPWETFEGCKMTLRSAEFIRALRMGDISSFPGR